ncbi:MAG TPA: YbjN domain-containing protein [Thermoleophilaceae bacterium]|jgi:hypothetical protein
MAAVHVVDEYLSSLPGDTRRLGHAEWGVTLDPDAGGGWPLDIGVRIDDGMLRAQAYALAAHDDLDPWVLLHWNRQTRYVRMACTRSGDVWVHGDLPVQAVDERAVDRLLGLVVEGALAARGYARALGAAEERSGGWLGGP